jgi:CHAT domain-containing protein
LELRKSGSPYAVEYAGALDRDRIQREILGQDTALIEFELGEKQSYVWVLTPHGSISAVLPPRKQIEQLVEEYRKELAQRPSALTVRTALVRVDALGTRLYRELLAPVESAFKESQRLIIVPDGVLAYLPFETLGGQKRLIERFAVSYSPSASVLATLRDRLKVGTPPAKELLAFGDAVYSPASTPASSALGQFSERGLDFTQLPYTRTEVTAIRSLFAAGASRIFMGAEAREETLKSVPLDPYRFIHFAVHGLYDEEQPARSGIALSVNADSREDGILQVREIMRLRLRAEMVTLSACQTGLGKLLDGEGVIGISRAFLYAGADSVLTSLWNVNDASTAELMRLVYRDLARGIRRDDALRAAKLQLIRGPQSTWRHPYYWAPFVLQGDSAPTSNK